MRELSLQLLIDKNGFAEQQARILPHITKKVRENTLSAK